MQTATRQGLNENGIEDYLRRFSSRRQPSPHTIKAYRSDLGAFARWCSPQPIDAASADQISGYVEHLNGGGAAARTLRRRVAALRGYYLDLVERGVRASSPFESISLKLPRPKSLPRALSRNDAARLARLASTMISAPGRPCDPERAIAAGVLLMISVGLRVGELVQLRCEDFHPQDGALYVRGKGRRDRRVFVVDPRLQDVLAKLSSEQGSSYLFSTKTRPWRTEEVRQGLRAMAQCAGLRRRVTPHMLRHTSATLLLEDGVDLLFLQRLLGHENISTTALYAHVADLSLRRALERAGLLASLAA